jgi:DNA invertase Pin-like site-specific DNA recombinase
MNTLISQFDAYTISSDDSNDSDEYDIERIIAHRSIKNDKYGEPILQFKFKYSGYDEDPNTPWVDEDDTCCEETINNYFAGLGINTLYIIVRVSTNMQVKNNPISSLTQQEDNIRTYISRHDAEFRESPHNYRIKRISIVGSAYSKMPLEIDELCEFVNVGDKIYVYHPDRLSRNLAIFKEWANKVVNRQANIYASYSTNCNTLNGENYQRFKAAVKQGEDESRNISRRVRDNKVFKNKKLVDKSIGVLSLIQELFDSGMNRKSIVSYLNMHNYKYNGNNWTIAALDAIINL